MTIRPHQHALPIVGARTANPNGSAPSPSSEYRPIHVSTFDRRGRDFYATPDWVTEALLQRFQFRGPIWEPCCGAGAMSTALAPHGYQMVSTDIADCGFGTQVLNFLASRSVRDGCRSINAPFGETAIHEGQGAIIEGDARLSASRPGPTATVEGQLALMVRYGRAH